MKKEINSSCDIIDSRNVIERIEELEAERDEFESDEEKDAWNESEEGTELRILLDLAGQGEGCADWQYGETLIRDSYFTTYAQELAEDIGAIGKDLAWPGNCIDWEQAASELQQDYSAIDFDGTTFWIRS